MEKLPSDCSSRNSERHVVITSLKYSPALILSMNNFREAFSLLVSHAGIKLWRNVNDWSGVRNNRNVERASITSCSSRFGFSLCRINEIKERGSGDGATTTHPNNFLYKSAPTLRKTLLKFCIKKSSMSPGKRSSSWLDSPECNWLLRALTM